MENIDPRIKLGNYFQQKILKYEIHILILIVFIIGLRLLNLIPIGLILTLALLSVATIYFFSAFAAPLEDQTSALDIFIHKLLSLGSSVAIIGILFMSQKWPLGDTMITIGFMTLGICLIWLLYQKLNHPYPGKVNQIVLIRLIILLLISAAIYYLNKK